MLEVLGLFDGLFLVKVYLFDCWCMSFCCWGIGEFVLRGLLWFCNFLLSLFGRFVEERWGEVFKRSCWIKFFSWSLCLSCLCVRWRSVRKMRKLRSLKWRRWWRRIIWMGLGFMCRMLFVSIMSIWIICVYFFGWMWLWCNLIYRVRCR